jgi:hypothetical protein
MAGAYVHWGYGPYRSRLLDAGVEILEVTADAPQTRRGKRYTSGAAYQARNHCPQHAFCLLDECRPAADLKEHGSLHGDREKCWQSVADGRVKRALGTRRPILVPDRANQRWSLDFLSDAFEDGHRFRVLCIVHDCTREALGTVVDSSLSGARMTRELDELVRRRGQPDMIVSDNGTEMTSHAVLRWCQDTDKSAASTPDDSQADLSQRALR